MNIDISIVICTYNRSASLNDTLESLLKIHKPENYLYNIIVIDNNSDDDTRLIVEKNQKKSPVDILYFFEKKQGLSNARNRGIKEAAGGIISFIDDDVRIDPCWIVEIVKAFNVHKPACVSGKVVLPQNLNKPSWWSKSYNGVLGEFDIGNDIIQKGNDFKGLIGIGANMSFKRDIFIKHGFFREDLGRKGSKLLMGEETELVERITRNGEKVIYFPSAIVYHYTDIKRFTKQYLRRYYYRGGEWEFAEKRLKNCNYKIQKWMFRSIAENYIKSNIHLFKGREKESFILELQAIQLIGYVSGAVKWRLSHKDDFTG